MDYLNVFVRGIGEFDKLNKYLNESKHFNCTQDDETLYVYVVKSQDINKLEVKENKFVIFTDGPCDYPHMECSELELQVIYSLETMIALSYTGLINITLGEIKNNITKCNKFYFLCHFSDTILEGMKESIYILKEDNFIKCDKAFINLTINIEAEYHDIKAGLEFFNSEVSVNDDVIMGETLNRSLVQQNISIILIDGMNTYQ